MIKFRFAKENHLRLWKNYVSTSSSNKDSFIAKVIEIGLGDNIIIQKDNGEEMKIYFSSFKSPRFVCLKLKKYSCYC